MENLTKFEYPLTPEECFKNDNFQVIYINDNCNVQLENMGKGEGQITITLDGKAYRKYWGAMSGTIEEFICFIDSDYFSGKILGSDRDLKLDIKSTFSGLRKYIKEDINLPWYKHLEFQKDMRLKIRIFENECRNADYDRFFVDNFHWFVDTLNFHLINEDLDRDYIKNEFTSIREPWHFICHTEGDLTKSIKKIHKLLIKHLKNNPKNV